MGCILNFIPWVVSLTTIAITAVISIATFPSIGHAVLIPASYLILASLEGSSISRMMVNPVVIFIGLTLWGFMWGIVPTLLAVPLLVMLKIFCDHIEPLASIGEFLGA